MDFVKTDGNGNVVTYPYKLAELVTDNPKVSFPCCFSEELAAEWDVFPVIEEEKPVYAERIQNCVRNSQPTFDGGNWTVSWTVSDKTAEETLQYDDDLAAKMREDRNTRLAETDWWAVADLTMSDAMVVYRQALRDIPIHQNWPNLEDADWPTKPN